MNQTVALAELSPVMNEILNAGGEVTFTITGTSMLPMLHHGLDKVSLIKPSGPLRKYDLPLYRRDNQQFVLHRIIQVKKDGTYIMCGDNQVCKEDSIRPDQIIGVVRGFYRYGRYYASDNWKYRLYCHLWVDFFAVRKIFRLARAFPGRLKRYIQRRISR